MQLTDATLLKNQAYLNGSWCDQASGRLFDVTNPANGESITRVPDMGAEETRQVIEQAHAAWSDWKSKLAKDRSAIIRRWFELVMANQDDLARILSWEQGKPLAEATGEIAYGASFIEWFSEEAKRVYGDIIPPPQTDRRVVVIKQPVGVAAAITPWNFPNAMITRKAGPALAVGCSIVIKPASATPLSALALAELAGRAGVPAGVSPDPLGWCMLPRLLDRPLVPVDHVHAHLAAGGLDRLTAATVKNLKINRNPKATYARNDKTAAVTTSADKMSSTRSCRA